MLDENNVEMGQRPKLKELEENSKRYNVLYLDDDEVMLENFQAIYSKEFTIFTTDCHHKAKEHIRNNDIHIIISDQRMPEITGVEFFESIVKQFPDPIRILLTAFTDVEVLINAINHGHVYQYIRKPYKHDYMKKMLNDAGEIYHRRKNSTSLNTTCQIEIAERFDQQ